MSDAQQCATEKLDDDPTQRACECYRLRKVRCLQDASSPSAKCLPCAKSNRECVCTDRSRKWRCKRADTRVADLEKEVKAMTALLKNFWKGKLLARYRLEVVKKITAPVKVVYLAQWMFQRPMDPIQYWLLKWVSHRRPTFTWSKT